MKTVKKVDFGSEVCCEKENVEETVNIYEGEEIEEEVDLELDTDDAVVYSADGVLINGNSEEIRLLFFYFKPLSNSKGKSNKLRCKGIVEFRMTPSRFKDVVEQLNEEWKKLSQYKNSKKTFSSDKPMFI